MPKKRSFRSSAIQHAYEQFIGDDPIRTESFEHELFNAEVARKLYDLRTRAGLSQRDLASRVGTTASVICRLEDADYGGHSLAMLKRIAVALGRRLELRFVASTDNRPLTKKKLGRPGH